MSENRTIVRQGLERTAVDNWAADQLITLLVGNEKKASKEVVRRELEETAREFAGPNPSFAERMLSEVAATTWLAFRYFEGRYAAAIEDGKLSIPQSESHQKRIERHHRRLMLTLRTLATIRKLATPVVQLNIANQQVNQVVAGQEMSA